ncbi:hypothetical protein [Candidatus Methanocrinis natronophilus]|uniref:Uncharacterized protein n=1 Tax=Candidatus Methanocrinis natronophilus TaxID=3033396 RepID=A0ABT5X4Y2_9EURY|nr:hypothetical protein [Candidatus Methanocrinis natronophilus]MDF0589647.1 hypothetical protein [Candidatus Methanocrinis natronophilus]
MKCRVMIMLICLVGTAAAAGYTSTQAMFLKGENPVRSSMNDARFEDYAKMYWASYLSNPDRAPMAPMLAGQTVDVENTMTFWRNNFPFDITASSFGDGADIRSASVRPRYDFAAVYTWRYDETMPIETSSFGEGNYSTESQLEKNTRFLAQDIMKNFGL